MLTFTPLKIRLDTPNLDNQHVAEELYKKNLELAERNKTLALLRQIDEIILSTVTDLEQVIRQITQAVVKEAGFKSSRIFLVNQKENLLVTMSVTYAKLIDKVDPNLQRALYSIKIPLSDENNIIVKTMKTKTVQTTNSYYDLFKSYLSQEASDIIQNLVGMKFFQIYPLIVRDESIGVMVISPKEEKEPFFSYQKDLIERLPSVVSVAIDNAMLYQKIQHANIRLKELDKLKDEFVSLASHELRTPMTAIKSYLWMVLNKSSALDPQVKSYLDIAYQETERLIKLVQNMLTISRIEGERLELNMERVDMYELTKRVYDQLKIKSDEKKINFTLVQYPEKLIINGDKDKLEEVLLNIIGNAVKYTPEKGTISVYFTLEQNNILIHTTDNGKGIAPEDVSKLFQKFGRLQEAEKSKTQGTGLGLYISKQIIELHKGSIQVDSQVGKGTTFTIVLPVV